MNIFTTNAFAYAGSCAILILSGIKRTKNRSMWPSPSEGRETKCWNRLFLLWSLIRGKGSNEMGLD